ncbi:MULTISPECIES: hypothetical protein [unclassified Frankia]|uniref:hypothetical protein n=1 Tax=unclassified Frankia TaxID=2632575 RepID=UPI000AA9AE96|nr:MULTISPECIES: hypothetical protein [unclassified Frankia]
MTVGHGRARAARVGRRLAWPRTMAVGLLLASAVAACGGGGDTSDSAASTLPLASSTGDPLAPQPLARQETLRIGVSSKLESFSALLLATDELAKENIKVELTYAGVSETTLLVTQGKLDMVFGSYTAGFFNIVSANPDVRFIFPGASQPEDSTQGFWANKSVLNPSGGELTAAAFKGKKILTVSGDGSPSAFQMAAWIRTLPGGDSVKPTDLTFEQFDATLVSQALQQGAAAAGQVNSPYDQQLSDDSCCEFMSGVIPTKATVSGIVEGRSMKGREDVTLAFVRAMARTTLDKLQPGYKEDPDTLSALAKVLEMDTAKLRSIPELYFDPTFQSHIAPALSDGQGFWRARGLLKYDKDLTESDLWDYRYLDAIGFAQQS